MKNCLNVESTVSATSLHLPAYFRLINLVRLPAASGKGIRNEATVYHEDASLRVFWHSCTVDCRLKHGSVVALRGAPNLAHSNESCLPIARLELVEKPVAAINPFLTVPSSWVADRELVQQAAALWEGLGRPLQHLINAVFWDGGRFYRFLTGPASTADHNLRTGSNFRHCVEMTEQAVNLAKGLGNVSLPLVVASALLSDAGKADDFKLSPTGSYCLSERGAKVGYQHTILEWLAVARAKVIVPDELYLSLVHALVASRRSCSGDSSIEGMILSVAHQVGERSRGWGQMQPS